MSRRVLSFALLAVLSVPGVASSERVYGWSPESAVRYSGIVRRIYETDKRPTLAELEEAIKLYQQDGDLWGVLAQARLAAKQYDAAIEAYKRAIELGGFQNQFRAGKEYDIACAYSLKGNKEEAFKWLHTSMESGFRDLQHLRTDADLNSLHDDPRWEETAATKDVSKMSRDEAMRYDLWLLNREMRRIHFDPYRVTPKEKLDAFVKSLHDRIPQLNDNEVKVGFMQFARLLGDGHTRVRPGGGGNTHAPSTKQLPLQLFWFDDGLFVTAAHPKIADLAGAQILEVAGKPFEEHVPHLDTIAFQDNTQGLKSYVPLLLTIPDALNGLGLAPASDTVKLKLKDAKGVVREVEVQAESGLTPDPTWATPRDMSEAVQPLYLKNRQKPYWFEFLADKKILYFQYNSVRNDPAEPIDKFAERMFGFIETNDVKYMVVDARWNGGGNSFFNRAFVNGLIGCKKVNAEGKLFVITGRNTFSAAQNFVTDLGRALDPYFVGEPTGSSPNFVGETIQGSLPYTKMGFTVSDLYWQRSWPMDYRNWIAPQLPAPPNFAAYKANRDPSMEAILAFISAQPGN